MSSPPEETAQYFRPSALPGVEALHATFVQHRYAAHVHDYWVVACVDQGAARFGLEGRQHVAPAGTVFVIPPDTIHTGESAGDDGYTYRVLYVDWVGVTHHSDTSLHRSWPPGSPVSHDRACLTALHRLHRVLPLPGRALEQGHALAAVRHVLDSMDHASAGQPGLKRHPAVLHAMEFIQEFWQDNFTLQELADAAGVSPFHLVRIFGRDVGTSPVAYRRALRVQAAQQQLRQGRPAHEVALLCGFYDQAHLSRHFKAVTGVTPKRYAAG